ncbi:isochorismate synthase [Pseudomonas rhizoryzae]|uniref:isochorismate synthase n=1 Tax=Pseudomonas rhizoryzae TaxID=2571129 RepID=UPI000735F3BA|nr:isochorismate synthase [Pseudomonas psychrotolerans]KTT71658.1 isochorismate synthase [Pseudomonas psychrotolerans]
MTSKRAGTVGQLDADRQEQAAFLFQSGDRVLHGRGICARVETPASGGAHGDSLFLHAVEQAFARARQAGIAEPVIMGAIPFDTTKASCLYVPLEHAWAARPAPVAAAPIAPALVREVRNLPSAEGFCLAVEEAIDAFRRGELSKAVLSRIQEIRLAEPADVETILANLAWQNPTGYQFRIPTADGGELVGVSPELLVRKQGARVHTNPLAGSAKRRVDPQEDERVARELLDSSKDHYEHRLVIEDIRQQLAPLCNRLDVPEGPSLLSTNAMWHLSTAIDGELADSRTSALQLACRLHPTPAVCGYPTAAARQLIQRIEPFDRGLFTGMVGWCDAQGNGEWVVTIRCGTVQGDLLRLFAGAGIVEASDPAAEWAEVTAKLGTMRAACGLLDEENPA